jgi:hypothetical protein
VASDDLKEVGEQSVCLFERVTEMILVLEGA